MDDPSYHSSSRKRSRSTTPLPDRRQTGPGESAADQLRAAQLRQPATRTAALNSLLQLSFHHDTNYSLTGDSILKELVRIAWECVEWKEKEDMDDENQAKKESQNAAKDGSTSSTNTPKTDQAPVFSSDQAWHRAPTPQSNAWAQHWIQQLSPHQKRSTATLHLVIMIWRNLSYVGANLRLLAYSPAVVDVLVGCLYDGYDGRRGADESNLAPTPLAATALQTLLNLVPQLDLSGQKLLADKLFYAPQSKDGPLLPDADSFGQAVGGGWGFGGMWLARRLDPKEDVMSDVSKEFVLSFTEDYLVSIWSIFPALCHVLTNTAAPRPVLIAAVDLLQELVSQARIGLVGNVNLEDDPDEIPTLRAILVKMPEAMLARLVDFLYIPRLGPDALDYNDPVRNIVTRVTPYRLTGGYDANVDTDIRDRTLDILVPLLELDSPRLAVRLGLQTETNDALVRTALWDALVPILTTSAGRNEAPHLATQVFQELAKAPENRPGALYVQERLLALACKNDRVAHTVGFLLFMLPAVEEEEESSEEQGSEDDDAEESA